MIKKKKKLPWREILHSLDKNFMEISNQIPLKLEKYSHFWVQVNCKTKISEKRINL